MCQGLGPKKHGEIPEIDRTTITLHLLWMFFWTHYIALCYIMAAIAGACERPTDFVVCVSLSLYI